MPIYRSVLILALLGLLISGGLGLLVMRFETTMLRDEVRKAAENRVEVLQNHILRSMEVLYSIRALYSASDSVTRQEFSAFVSEALKRQPELQALAWDPLVPGSERSHWEERARQEGFASFQFTEETASKSLVPAAPREVYYPVYFLETLEKNQPAFGFDVGSEPRRRAALEKSRATDRPVATAPIELAQGRVGFLVFLPVRYRSGEFCGFAVAVFRLHDLVENSLRPLKSQNLSVLLRDGEEREPFYEQWVEDGAESPFDLELKLDVAGRTWHLKFHPASAFLEQHGSHWALIVFAGGLLCSGLALSLGISSSRRTAQIEQSVAEKTAALSSEIAERVRAEEELKRARDHLEISVRERTDELARTNEALLNEIRERKEAEQEAAAANQAKSLFLANMSHEIRSPMNAILGYCQILERDASLVPFQRDAVATIASSGQHLLQLVDEILDLSKIEAGRMELQTTTFEVVDLLRELAAMFQQPCNAKQLPLVLDWQGGVEGGRVCGDVGKLRQVLINLVANAVKFTDHGKIILQATPTPDGACRFEIRDTGLGIPAEMLERIFEPFQQEPTAARRGGTGLGLSIARRQVELMGGTLEVNSEPGKGSTFWFSIPLPPAEGETGERPVREVKRLAPGHTVKALVVDDIAENRDVLAHFLTRIGCEVLTASDGPQALRLVEQERPAIILLDMRMPEMNGIEVTQRLVERHGPAAFKIVLMSASVLQHEREACLKAGCDDFLGKPIRAAQVYLCLQNLLDVEFEYEATESQEPKEPLDLASITLPEDLSLRLMMAAELHSATVMKNCLKELAALSPSGERLAHHLREFMASYDMETILRIVTQIPVVKETE